MRYREFLPLQLLKVLPLQRRVSNIDWSNLYVIKTVFRMLAIFLGVLQIWANRHLFWYDAIAYLDISDAYFKGDWDLFVNATWSPFYSWILSIALFVIKPSPYWELMTVKLVNLVIYLLALWCFEVFLHELLKWHSNQSSQDADSKSFRLPDWALMALGYTLFIWSSVEWIFVHRDSPDMLVAGLVYLASAMVLRISANPVRWSNYVILGTLLGLGYLAKASMLPLGFVFIITSVRRGSDFKKNLLRLTVVTLIMLSISAPWITALSLQKSRLTFGDVGKLNYAWYVSPRAPDLYWQGKPPGSGTPVHPTKQLFKDKAPPYIYEFATPIAGSFPPWYDPSYWNEGLKPVFDLRLQFWTTWYNLIFCWGLFLRFLFFSYLILVVISGYGWSRVKANFIANWGWRLLFPAIAGLSGFVIMTDITHNFPPWGLIQSRYLAPFIVLLFASVFPNISFLKDQDGLIKKRVINLILCVLILFNSFLSLKYIGIAANAISLQHTHWQLADQLLKKGINPGDKVAMILDRSQDQYWARLAKVKIIAAVDPFIWDLIPKHRDIILKTLKNKGVKAIIQPRDRKSFPTPSDMKCEKLKNPRKYICLLE